jgi:WD40 repeat protein
LQTLYIDSTNPLDAIAIEESTGRIAVCDQHSVYIYDAVGRDEGLLRWQETHEHKNDNVLITSLSWASPEELLLGGSRLRLWYLPDHGSPRFIWDQSLPYPTAIAYASPDGEIIASCGRHDRMVKIWRRLSYEVDSTRFDVSYLPHPTAVTNLHWRKPWHTEQNLDSLLYSLCADNKLRVWAHLDHHSPTVMDRIAEIDMCETIQPRRLSVGSMSRRRYAFIIDSRDFSSATEKAVQITAPTSSDHALEHLIEIANRSPEILVVLDGLGHMSAWGLENAGCKNKRPAEVFNITHVADLNVPITQKNGLSDYTQFCIFAGGATDASLSILVHSFDGSIAWHDVHITHLFDTAPRKDRARLLTSWAGHDDPVEGIVRSQNGKLLCSWTGDGDVIVWKARLETNSTSLLLQHSFALDVDIIDADFFGDKLVLTEGKCLQMLPSKAQYQLHRTDEPRMLSRLSSEDEFGIFYGGELDVYSFETGAFLRKLQSPPDSANSVILPVQEPWRNRDLITVSPNGMINIYASNTTTELKVLQSFPTLVRHASQISAFDQKLAMVDKCGTLTIWDSVCGVCEASFDFSAQNDAIESLAWHQTPRGTILLAVACTFKVIVLTNHRYEDSAWQQMRELRIRNYTSHAIACLCFLSDGSLVIGAGNQLFVPEISIVAQDTSAVFVRETYIQPTQLIKRPPPLSLTRVADAFNCQLPVYHPEVLHLLLDLERLDLASGVLMVLHEQLKYFSEGDRLSSTLDLDEILTGVSGLEPFNLSQFMAQPNGNHNVTNGDSGLEKIEERLKENIEKQRIPFLCDNDRKRLVKVVDVIMKVEAQAKSIDKHGLYYLHALYATGDGSDLPWSAIMHASLSTSQDALVDLVTQEYGGKLTWTAARKSGMFMWLSEPEALRMQMENVGRAEYTKHEDRSPVDCSLYYLALDKKSVLLGLWRTSIGAKERTNTMKLLANDFSEPKWKSTALKNAYALMSKRRFEYAAAFFVLGGSIQDAVNVCAQQIGDLQLAVALARVYDNHDGGAVLREVMQKHVLGAAVHSLQGRWMACWAYWTMLDQRKKAVQSLIRPLYDVTGSEMTKESLDWRINDPRMAGMYATLRQQAPDSITPREEFELVMRSTTYLRRMGCGFLALDLVRHWKFAKESVDLRKVTEAVPSVDLEDIVKEAETNEEAPKKKPPPTQFVEPSADSLLDSFGF